MGKILEMWDCTKNCLIKKVGYDGNYSESAFSLSWIIKNKINNLWNDIMKKTRSSGTLNGKRVEVIFRINLNLAKIPKCFLYFCWRELRDLWWLTIFWHEPEEFRRHGGPTALCVETTMKVSIQSTAHQLT